MAKRVLVIDDRQMMRDSIERSLLRAGYAVLTAASGRAAVEGLDAFEPDVVLTDLRMDGGDGLFVAEKVRQLLPGAAVVLMTAHASVDSAVAAMKLGAVDVIQKPFSAAQLLEVVEHACSQPDGIEMTRDAIAKPGDVALRSGLSNELSREQSNEQSNGQAAAHDEGSSLLIGASPAMVDLRRQLLRMAESTGCVLIEGEAGSGKQLAARFIHEKGPRRGGPFVVVNCAGLDAIDVSGAAGGTVVFDRVGELSAELQADLLRLLQRLGGDGKAVRRSGDEGERPADVRVIATAGSSLAEAVEADRFRQDLYYRLNVLFAHVPALRDRLADVPLLIEHFLGAGADQGGCRAAQATGVFSAEASDALAHHHWPGNVRELRNICERARVLGSGRPIGASTVRGWLVGSGIGSGAGGGQIVVGNMGQISGILGQDRRQNGVSRGCDGTPDGRGGAADAPGDFTERLGTAGTASGSAACGIASDGIAAGGIDSGGTDSGGIDSGGSVQRLEDVERQEIVRALAVFDGNRQRTAAALGIGVRTLGLKLKKWKQNNLVAQSL